MVALGEEEAAKVGFWEHGFGDGAVDQLDPGQALGQWG
jgi:hypothetical protein